MTRVPRSRFLPVKLTSDLLLLMSNLYEIQDGSLTVSSKRNFPTQPLVKMSQEFKAIRDFQERFNAIPDLLELDHLTVAGDVRFGRDIVLKSSAKIISAWPL
ncbi:unnamed protein product [Protopolystoma xenopodis]|uniref:UTP--glucose-1-phosphate uridylyltransferase n=1 Tax=Protopolystoma xenopodis TaxID=117903 RepID=A0A448WPN5_9PLAT|nr:unnamed protein product [Protopolystoma xenopodis]